MTQDLLIEIGTEELPPASLFHLSDAFTCGITAQLTDNGIGYGAATSFCTPRRLAVLVADVEHHQAQRESIRRGPSTSAAFGADGLPTKALEGFARSCGVSVADLSRERSEKGQWMVYRAVVAGQTTAQLIPKVVEGALEGLPIGKRMRWGSGDAEFVRPVHWICIVFGDQGIAARVLGVSAGVETFGHRFHAPGPLRVASASLYPALLRERGFVEPCFQARRSVIAAQVKQLAVSNQVVADMPATLLDEVTALVEWPRAIFGSFDDSFLAVPAEALIETMEKNQKYFPVRNADGHLQANFIAVANIESKCPEQVIQGNERVIRPRFADAKFFWQQDLRHPLEAYFPRLESVVFQEKLGSLAQRSRRVAVLARSVAELIGEDADLAERAAILAKCDLVTAMVAEFPRLQGTMGRYYAERSGESAAVCAAIQEQYLPRFAGDALPPFGCGLALALADRLDLLVGAFGIGQRPTGARDPYALRRASISVVRILIETPLDLDLSALLETSQSGFAPGILEPDAGSDVLAYIVGRLDGYYLEQGVTSDTVAAVVAAGSFSLCQLDRRIRAVQSFRGLPSGLALASANKRISNILSKSDSAFDREAYPDPGLFIDDAERELGMRVCELERSIAPLVRVHDYAAVLGRLSELRADIDRFFAEVMVLSDNTAVRENRLMLLQRVQALFFNVADISILQ